MVTVAGPRGPRTTVLPYYRTTLLTWQHSGGAEHACACFCGHVRRGMWLTYAQVHAGCGGASRAGSPHTGSVFFVFSGFNMMCKSDTFDPSDRASEFIGPGSGGPPRSARSSHVSVVMGMRMDKLYMNDDRPRLASLNTVQHTTPTQHCTQQYMLVYTVLNTVQDNTCTAHRTVLCPVD